MGTFARNLLLLATPLLSLAAPSPNATDEYDYIVVGSGPGGGPLASNLARANYSVLLIEAGDLSPSSNEMGYPPELTWDFFVNHYDHLDPRGMRYNKLVWKRRDGSYWVGPGTSRPPRDPQGEAERLGVYYPRGATVGGSSMINAMCVWLPADSEWDYIADLTGDKSWRAKEIRKLFERIEKNHYVPPNTPGHGFTGYFETNMAAPSISQPVLGVMQAVTENFTALTSPEEILKMMSSDPNVLDPKRDWTNGIFGLVNHMKANGDRYSSRDYILDTIAKGFPLTLSTDSLATQVLFSKPEGWRPPSNNDGKKRNNYDKRDCNTQPRATGIEYLHSKSVYGADPRFEKSIYYDPNAPLKTAHARREVILSAGTFNTPQLLMLSGIGEQQHLRWNHIPLLVDSPNVGKNLQDNQEMPIIGHVTVGVPSPAPERGTLAISMLTTPHSPDGERDMFTMQGFGGAFRGFWPFNQSNADLPVDPPNTYGVSMVKGKSVNHGGYIRLRHPDPTTPPEINFRHYSRGRETDLGAMKDTIAWARRAFFLASKKYNVTVEPKEPPCPSGIDEETGYCSNEVEDEEWIEGQTFGHHPTSTAAIGKKGDWRAVLDSKFRVNGVVGLRVVDASVFPKIPGVFPVVSTFLVSEKASDVILEGAGRGVCEA